MNKIEEISVNWFCKIKDCSLHLKEKQKIANIDFRIEAILFIVWRVSIREQ